jgi:hypothetical protein
MEATHKLVVQILKKISNESTLKTRQSKQNGFKSKRNQGNMEYR